MQFELNLSLVLAHSALLFTKDEYSPNGVVDDARNGGDPPPPKTEESTREVMQAFEQFLPRIMQSTAGAVPITEGAKIDTAEQVAPRWAALQNLLYQTYGPGLNRTGADIADENAERQASRDLSVVSGTGRDLVREADKTARIADPEFYRGREEAGARLSDLLSNGLSGGERSEIERSLNRRNNAEGSLATPTATSTVENAATFGGALRDRMGKALEVSAQVLPQLRSGVDPFKVATGRESTANTGDSRFMGANQQIGAEGFGTANNFLGGVNQLRQQENQINADRRDSFDRATQFMGSLPSIS